MIIWKFVMKLQLLIVKFPISAILQDNKITRCLLYEEVQRCPNEKISLLNEKATMFSVETWLKLLNDKVTDSPQLELCFQG